MKEESEDLIELFKNLKSDDQAEVIPDWHVFTKGRQKRIGKKQVFIPVGIAAAVLLGVIFFNNQRSTEVEQNETSVLVIEVYDDLGIESFKDQQTSLDHWESPTATLINDFNEW